MKYLKFSENLKNALKCNNLREKDLAELLGTTQQTVSRWILGVNEPDFSMLLEICLYLNETPSSLLGFDDISNETAGKYYQACKKNKDKQ